MFGVGLLALGLLAQLGATDPTAVEWTDNAACEGCHPVVAAQWAGSQHRTAFTDASFQTALAIEPSGFCRGCHAPEQPAAVTEATAAAKLGVACVTCHLEAGSVLATTAASSEAPHPVTRRPSFSTASACAGCHAFPFPDSGLRDAPEMMQSTLQEHAASPFADWSCASCHMPEMGGVRSHAFGASRNPAMLRQAVRVEAVRTAEGVELVLRAGEVGHAVPTGDLLRRLEVGAEVDGAPPRRRFLARHFGPRTQAHGLVVWGEFRDDRVPADGTPRRVRLTLPDAPGQEIRWWVKYQRVAHQRSVRESDALLDAEVLLANGALPSEESP